MTLSTWIDSNILYQMTTGPEVKTASTKKDQTRIPTDNHSSPRPSETEINFQLIQHRQTQSKDSELPKVKHWKKMNNIECA